MVTYNSLFHFLPQPSAIRSLLHPPRNLFFFSKKNLQLNYSIGISVKCLDENIYSNPLSKDSAN